jgi:hypothetical protein
MFALAILAPGLILGAIAWGAVGVLRTRGREEFTLATAANFYAQVLMVAGVLAVLAGIGVLIKLGFSQIDPAYSYFVPTPPVGAPADFYSGPTISQQQTNDLILAPMLIGVGLLVAGGHWLLSRFVGRMPGASPAWVVGGTLVAMTVLCGLAGILSLFVGGYQTLSYFIVGGQQANQFGDAASTAITFVPAWVVMMTVLLRHVRRTPAQTPTGKLVPA